MDEIHHIIRKHCRPLTPLPTGEQPVLTRLPGIRTVLFDLYGTLFVSGVGDLASTSADLRGDAFEAALAAVGLQCPCSGEDGVARFVKQIAVSHAASHESGVEHAEVDIVEIWRGILSVLFPGELVEKSHDDRLLARLAAEFEVRVNPVWPMPHLSETLHDLRKSGHILGIVSNAQFFTPMLFPVLRDQTVDEAGFDADLQFYSYRFGEAKPGRLMFDAAREDLIQRGIEAAAVLYVGNDMLNDVWAASQAGFRTALFAGDARSLRRRKEDSRMTEISPDLVLTDLSQLSNCV